jgi:hypothetical protein
VETQNYAYRGIPSAEWCHQAKIPGISGHLGKAQTTRNNVFSWYHQNLIIYI